MLIPTFDGRDRAIGNQLAKGQLKPAYNVQIAVNSEYITGIEAFSNWTDVGTFIPFMRKLELAHQ